MAYSVFPATQSSWTYKPTPHSYHTLPGDSAPMPTSQEGESNDLIRLARDSWVVRHTNLSDSSDIIDSIDVDMVDANQDESTIESYLILDTNILISHLPVLKQALARIEQGRLNVVILVPGIVVSELDYQKNSARGIATESRRASDWLAGEIGNGGGRVKGQAYTQTMLHSGDWRQRSGLSNDELILDCCKYFGHVKRKDVLLCTSDNNLAVQASANAMNLFIRGVEAVIRPSRELWDDEQLLERIIPGFAGSTAASIHAPRGKRVDKSRTTLHSSSVRPRSPTQVVASAPHPTRAPEDDAGMEVDMDGHSTTLNDELRASPGDRRDKLHKLMAEQLGQHLRKLTGKAVSLQQHRRIHDSMFTPANTKYTGKLPAERDWKHAWSLRECLKFVAKISPPQSRTWIFDEGEASSLADFLGLPGEKGARPGREWAKYDWGRGLVTVRRLGQDFEFEDLDHRRMAEYEYAVMEVFASD